MIDSYKGSDSDSLWKYQHDQKDNLSQIWSQRSLFKDKVNPGYDNGFT